MDKVSSYIVSDATSLSTRKLNAILRTIERQYKDDVSLPYLAELMGMNPDYLGRIFREYSGYTVVEYLSKVRIDKAKELLKSTDMRVKEVAAAVGYSNFSYFSQVFKKATGMTPKTYQDKNISL